jgi:hypothetical protein
MKFRIKLILLTIFIGIIISYLFSSVSSLQPFGANYTLVNSSTAPIDDPASITAQAGNVSELNIFGYSVTQSWQGYFGNVSGSIFLANSNDNVFYNWSVIEPQGEIYASINQSVMWGNVACFNYSAKGTFEDDSSFRGETSVNGLNLSQLETLYNIGPNDVDGVNETFMFKNHQGFFTANLEFGSGECYNTKVYNSSGAGTFDEVLLYSPENKMIIFTSIILDDANGFDGRGHDFEMLVLEDGHGGDTSSTPYYFYVELQ